MKLWIEIYLSFQLLLKYFSQFLAKYIVMFCSRKYHRAIHNIVTFSKGMSIFQPLQLSFHPRSYYLGNVRGFHKHTTLAIIPILAPEALQCENKNSSNKMLPTVGIEPGSLITSDSKSNTILSGLTCHVLPRRSLNLCSCTT